MVVIFALIVGAVYLNAPSQTSNSNSGLSFTYSASKNTFTFYAVNGYTNYVWNFGDSSTGAGSIVSHTYQTNGNYTVTLTASSLTGSSEPLSAVQQVLVTTLTTLIHHYFVSLNVTMGNSAT